jgi:hypothetical protein
MVRKTLKKRGGGIFFENYYAAIEAAKYIVAIGEKTDASNNDLKNVENKLTFYDPNNNNSRRDIFINTLYSNFDKITNIAVIKKIHSFGKSRKLKEKINKKFPELFNDYQSQPQPSQPQPYIPQYQPQPSPFEIERDSQTIIFIGNKTDPTPPDFTIIKGILSKYTYDFAFRKKLICNLSSEKSMTNENVKNEIIQFEYETFPQEKDRVLEKIIKDRRQGKSTLQPPGFCDTPYSNISQQTVVSPVSRIALPPLADLGQRIANTKQRTTNFSQQSPQSSSQQSPQSSSQQSPQPVSRIQSPQSIQQYQRPVSRIQSPQSIQQYQRPVSRIQSPQSIIPIQQYQRPVSRIQSPQSIIPIQQSLQSIIPIQQSLSQESQDKIAETDKKIQKFREDIKLRSERLNKQKSLGGNKKRSKKRRYKTTNTRKRRQKTAKSTC